MTGLNSSTRPWRDVLAAIAAAPELADTGASFASTWTANMATPAILVVPATRVQLRGSSPRWELALQVVVPIQGDDDEPLHALLELCLATLPAGVIVGDTTYGSDERAGATYIVSTTTLSV